MSKFKISPRATNTPATGPAPETVESFAAGAEMVQSQAGKRPEKPIRLNVDLEPETHRRLKMRAVESGKTIAELVRELIAREI